MFFGPGDFGKSEFNCPEDNNVLTQYIALCHKAKKVQQFCKLNLADF